LYKKVNKHSLYDAGEVRIQFFFLVSDPQALFDTDVTVRIFRKISGCGCNTMITLEIETEIR